RHPRNRVSARQFDKGGAKGFAGKRQRARSHFISEPDIAHAAGQMAARKYSWLTAAATAAECPILEGRPGCAESHDAAAHGTSSIQCCMFELPLAHGSARLCARKFRRPGPMARGCRFFRNSSGRNKGRRDRKSTRLNSSHVSISYAVFCLK